MFPFILVPWLEHVEGRVDLAPSTKVEYARVAKLLGASAAVRVRDGTVDLGPYVAERRAAGMAPRTIALELRVASVAFRWAQRAGLVGASLALRLPRIHTDRTSYVLNHRTPSVAEAAAAIDAMPRAGPRHQERGEAPVVALLMARTGARVGEVVHLRSSDLDEELGQVRFGASEGASKTGERRFPLDAATLEELAGRSGRGDAPLFDFEGAGGRGRGRVVRAAIQAIGRRLNHGCDRANVPRFSPHGLRRMVVDRLLRRGVDPGTAATLTGHSVVVMLKFYQQVSEDDRRAAVESANLSGVERDGTEGRTSTP